MKDEKFYLNQVSKLTETGSDYAVAKLLKVSTSRICNYRNGRSRFDEEMCIRVAEALRLDPLEVLAAINSEKARTEKARNFWKDTLHRITGTAAAVILSVAVLLGFNAPSTAYARSTPDNNIYYAYTQYEAMLHVRYRFTVSFLCGDIPQRTTSTLQGA